MIYFFKVFLKIFIPLFLFKGEYYPDSKNIELDDFTIQKKQNILFIGVDDLRPLINSYGYKNMITPNIDKLAKQGVQFNQAYTNVAVCGASRASILTGVRGSNSRFYRYYSRADEDLPQAVTLAKLFKKNGYTTASLGKIYHHSNDNIDEWDIHRSFQNHKSYQNPKSNSETKRRNERHPSTGAIKSPAFEYADVEDDAYNDGKLTNFAIKTLEKFKNDKDPFFLAVGYISPHLPFIQPQKYGNLYDDNDLIFSNLRAIPKNAPSRANHEWTELRNAYLDIPQSGPVSAEMEKDLIKSYYASVSYMDAMVGKLIQSLDDLGLRENTTIIFWSDHGFFLGEHGFWCKHHTFNEAIHVPLIVSSPGMKKNVQSDALVEYVDIYPTLSEIAGLTPPDYIHGKSFVPILKNPDLEFKQEIYSRYQFREVVQDKEFSYHEILYYPKTQPDRNGAKTHIPGTKIVVNQNMLFDMKNDKLQSVDISGDPNYKNIVERYSKKLKEMRDFSEKSIF
jgi:arylsulfatase A-like enzyme